MQWIGQGMGTYIATQRSRHSAGYLPLFSGTENPPYKTGGIPSNVVITVRKLAHLPSAQNRGKIGSWGVYVTVPGAIGYGMLQSTTESSRIQGKSRVYRHSGTDTLNGVRMTLNRLPACQAVMKTGHSSLQGRRAGVLVEMNTKKWQVCQNLVAVFTSLRQIGTWAGRNLSKFNTHVLAWYLLV